MNGEDRDLARRLLRGDERAFEEFFRTHFHALFRFALSRMRNDADAAEEVAQATLCRAITRLHTYRGEATLFTWLCTFCRHEIAAWFGRRGRQPPAVSLLEDHPEVRAARIVIVDFHAEATAEKLALARYADGRVTAVIGTHTHVPSADARVLPGGTAYVTDAGMTGPHGGVIGVEADAAIERFLRLTPNRFDVCASDVRFQAVALDVDEDSGRARAIERIDESIE